MKKIPAQWKAEGAASDLAYAWHNVKGEETRSEASALIHVSILPAVSWVGRREQKPGGQKPLG